MWFDRGGAEGDKESFNALGIIHRDGLLGGNAREDVAVVQFKRAATLELPEAFVNMGKIYYSKSCTALLESFAYPRVPTTEQGNIQLAKQYFDSALRHGSQYQPYDWSAERAATIA